MKLLFENWRKYLNEAYLDTEVGSNLTNRGISPSLMATDNPVITNTVMNIVLDFIEKMKDKGMIAPEIDKSGNIDSKFSNKSYIDASGRKKDLIAAPEWIRGNINDPENIEIRFPRIVKKLSELHPNQVASYVKRAGQIWNKIIMQDLLRSRKSSDPNFEVWPQLD